MPKSLLRPCPPSAAMAAILTLLSPLASASDATMQEEPELRITRFVQRSQPLEGLEGAELRPVLQSKKPPEQLS